MRELQLAVETSHHNPAMIWKIKFRICVFREEISAEVSTLAQTTVPGNAELQKGTMEGVQKLLGIQQGGSEALVGLALLTGGDYHMSGAVDVGPASAVTALRHLLADHEVLSPPPPPPPSPPHSSFLPASAF